MNLSTFQIEKLTYYFNFFDGDGNGILTKNDLGLMMKRVLEYTDWPGDSVMALKTKEVHDTFFEVLFERADEDSNRRTMEITLEEWLGMWERIIPGTMGMANFPVWMRLLPQTMFNIIDGNEDGVVDTNELTRYYEKMCGVDPLEARTQAVKAMGQMTDNGAYPLNVMSFEQVFANFLIGRTPFGPGRFLFACFSHRDPTFQLIEPMKGEQQINLYDQRRDSGAKEIRARPTPKIKAMI